MSEKLKLKNLAILIFSLFVLYFLGPILDYSKAFFVSLTFALTLILSSNVKWDAHHIKRYIAFIIIDVTTYHMLLSDKPWDLFLDGGLYESSIIPLVVCCIIMSFAGGLLLETKRDRWLYVAITLGIQIPIGLMIGMETLQAILTEISQRLNYPHYYSGTWEVWQFEWMVTYYLPIYLLSHKKRKV